MLHTDLNCDLGEGIGNDEALMPFISSANIACGYHAGDEKTMWKTVEHCLAAGVAVGAHPSFHDRENFGRTEQSLAPAMVYEIVVQQLLLLEEIAVAAGGQVVHVKPHGALYNMAACDRELAKTIAMAVKHFNSHLILFGLSGSLLIEEGKAAGLVTVNEVFADRTYLEDGSLTPRSIPGALITDSATAVKQVLQMVKDGTVTSTGGKVIPVVADTVCLHGDGAHAVEFARAIDTALKAENISISGFKNFTT